MLFGQHFDGEPPRNLNHVFLRPFGNGFNKKIGMFMFKNQNDGATLTRVDHQYSLFHATFNTIEHSGVQCSKELSASAAHPRWTHASSPCSCTVDPMNWLAESVLWTHESATDLLPHSFHVSLCAVSHCSDSCSKIRCWKLHETGCS